MQAVESISMQSAFAPNTPPPAMPVFGGKVEQQRDQQHDLPSPPTSVSKALSQRSIDEVDEKADLAPLTVGSPLNKRDTDKNIILTPEDHRDAPPSPPPSTHSGEDSHTPIRPSYFYPQPADAEATGVTSTIKADEALGIPVFEPTWEEFQDFYNFCQRIDEWGMKTGIVKVIPPKEWIDLLPRLDGRTGTPSTTSEQAASGSRYTENNLLSQVRIKNSIEQIFTPAGSGSWRQSNVVHPARILNAKQWADVCATESQKGPEMSRMKENAKREEVEGLEEDGVRTRSGRGNRVVNNRTSLVPSRTATKRKRSTESEKPQEEAIVDSTEEAPAEDAINDDMPELEENDTISKGKLKMADRTTQQEWNSFDYVEGWCQEAGQNCKPIDWNHSVCKAIESEYWRGLNFGKAPMYGADLKGTLFTSATQHWNVGCLDNILTRLRLRRKLPGVTTPYLYFGMWRATFAWHVEDMDLYSINYIHFGAPKQWYAIRQSDRQRFELTMAGAFPGDSARCKHFMRHKSYLASPAFLAASAGIKPLRLVQKAQEFVITYPYGYHSGFNLGYNCAESVNFALESWLDIGRKAGYCDCANDSVKMDVDAMLEESKEMQELDRKREEREKKKEADEKLQQSEEQRLDIRRAKERERRRLRKEEHARLEALGLLPSGDALDNDSPAPPTKKTKTQSLPCVFCPSASREDLVVIPYPEDEAEQGKKPIQRAHRLCACFMPETWVGPNPKWSEGSKEPSEIVMGFSGIEKARWSLKCQSCLDPTMVKRGAKVQCTFGKCSRTTHVSCALYTTSGWMLDMVGDEEADLLEGKIKKVVKNVLESNQTDIVMQETAPLKQKEEMGEEEEATRIVILCRSHNPREREKEVRRRAEILHKCVETLADGQMIKVRMGSGVWETVLREVRWPEIQTDEGEVVVDDGEVSVKWSKIVFDGEVVKKLEEEQRQKEEEEMSVMLAEAAAPESVQSRIVDDEEKEQRKKEKEQAKAAEAEKRFAAKQAKKEEDKRFKEAIKLEKKAEKEAKEAEAKEAKTKIQAQKKAEREAARSVKVVKRPSNMQNNASHSGMTQSTAEVNHSMKQSDYNYMRQWQALSQDRNLPRPVLPGSTFDMMERTLHPVWQQQQQRHPSMTIYSSAAPPSNTYPAHLASYQSRPLQHPSYPTQQHQHLQIRQHPQGANRYLESNPNLPYITHYAPRPIANTYAFHQQQSYNGQQYPSPPVVSLPIKHIPAHVANGAVRHPHYSTHQAPNILNRLQTEESSERSQQ